jgi:tubulin-specific chaperone A
MISSTKTLKIKTNGLKRIYKDYFSYTKETLQDEAKLGKLKSDGTDSAVVAQQEKVLAETKTMVYDSGVRFRVWYDELAEMVAPIKDELTMATEDYKEAKKCLDDLAKFRNEI